MSDGLSRHFLDIERVLESDLDHLALLLFEQLAAWFLDGRVHGEAGAVIELIQHDQVGQRLTESLISLDRSVVQLLRIHVFLFFHFFEPVLALALLSKSLVLASVLLVLMEGGIDFLELKDLGVNIASHVCIVGRLMVVG